MAAIAGAEYRASEPCAVAGCTHAGVHTAAAGDATIPVLAPMRRRAAVPGGLHESASSPALFSRVTRRKLRLLPSDCISASLGYLSVRDVCAAACVDTTLARCVRDDALWADIAARMDVTVEPPARTFKTAVRLALSESVQWTRGEYVAAQRLARPAGFSRNFFTCMDVLGDKLICGSTNGGVRAYRIQEVKAPVKDGDKAEGKAAVVALVLQHDFVVSLHSAPILGIAWLDGGNFLTASADTRILIANAANPRAPAVPLPQVHEISLSCMSIRRALTGMPNDQAPAQPSDDSSTVTSSGVDAARSRTWMVTGDESGFMVLWDMATRQAVHSWPAHTDCVSSAVWAPITHEDRNVLALFTASFDVTVSMWIFPVQPAPPEADMQAAAGTAAGSNGAVAAAVVGPPIQIAFEGIPRSAYRVYDIACSPDGRLLAAGCGDGIVRGWDVRAPTAPLFSVTASPLWIKSLAFAAGSRALFVGGGDHRVRVFDVSVGRDSGLHLAGVCGKCAGAGPAEAADVHMKPSPAEPHHQSRAGAAAGFIEATSLTKAEEECQRYDPIRPVNTAAFTPFDVFRAGFGNSSHVSGSSIVKSLSHASLPQLTWSGSSVGATKAAVQNARPAILGTIAAIKAASKSKNAMLAASQACRYAGTLDVHSGPIMLLRAVEGWLISVSADESVAVRRHAPQWTRYLTAEDWNVGDDGLSQGTACSIVGGDTDRSSTGLHFEPFDLGLDLDASFHGATGKLSEPAGSVVHAAPGGLLAQPLPVSQLHVRPLSVRSHSQRSQAPLRRPHGVDPELPSHPKLPFRLDNPAMEVLWPSGRTLRVGQQPPVSPRRAARSRGAYAPPGSFRMAGGPGATPIQPLRMKRPGWQQGTSLFEHVSQLLSLTPD